MPPNTGSVQQYWLPGYGLSRQIVLRQIQLFLGPTATVRPYLFQGREGYLIVGMPLTKEQIQDLKRQSKEFERQQSLRMTSGRSTSNENEEHGEHDINRIIVVDAQDRRPRSHYSSNPRSYR